MGATQVLLLLVTITTIVQCATHLNDNLWNMLNDHQKYWQNVNNMKSLRVLNYFMELKKYDYFDKLMEPVDDLKRTLNSGINQYARTIPEILESNMPLLSRCQDLQQATTEIYQHCAPKINRTIETIIQETYAPVDQYPPQMENLQTIGNQQGAKIVGLVTIMEKCLKEQTTLQKQNQKKGCQLVAQKDTKYHKTFNTGIRNLQYEIGNMTKYMHLLLFIVNDQSGQDQLKFDLYQQVQHMAKQLNTGLDYFREKTDSAVITLAQNISRVDKAEQLPESTNILLDHCAPATFKRLHETITKASDYMHQIVSAFSNTKQSIENNATGFRKELETEVSNFNTCLEHQYNKNFGKPM